MMGCVPSMRVSHTDASKRDPGNTAAAVTDRRTPGGENCPPAGRGRATGASETTEAHSNCVNASRSIGKGAVSKSVEFSQEMIICDATNRQNGGRAGLSGSNVDACLGPLKIQLQSPMSVLLVFTKKDAQCDAFLRAAEMAKYPCQLAPSVEVAVQLHHEHHHDVIIIDTRTKKGIDCEALARQIRSTHSSEYTVLAAVRSVSSSEKEDQSMLPLLKSGFNRQFIENSNVSVCLSELQCMEHGEVLAQWKLRAAQALLMAVDHCSDSIEIMNKNHEVQYVNSMFEKMFGYSGDEIIGTKFHNIFKSDQTKNDVTELIDDQLRNGKPWHGTYHIRRKNGETIPHKCRIYPVLGHLGKICHFVAIRNSASENAAAADQTNGCLSHSPVAETFTKRIRKDSLSRVHSLSIEAPITKAISMISKIQEEVCSKSVIESLDKVLEVLRSSELYSPYFTQQVRDNKMTSELVGGLMKMDDDLWSHRKGSSTKRLSCSSETPFMIRSHSHLSGLTICKVSAEVQDLLDREEKWDFDIIQLEKLTEKRPLMHLAMRTFQRYEVPQFLQVDEWLLHAWLQMIESNYHAANPYHNSTHAADVMHATSYFLACDIIKNTFDQMDEVACLIAAVVHDLDHPGKTNSYLVNSSGELAILYNDLAVLENHHVSLAYSLTLNNEHVNIFKNLSREDYRSLRQQVVDMVLATEMTKHFEHLHRFISVINQPPLMDENSDVGQRLLDATAENRILVKRMLIKCADVSNPARPLKLCTEWAKRIASEYCQQTDDEKAQCLPVVMPTFDRRMCNVPKSQISFMDVFIHDMFEAWSKFCNLPEMKQYIKENYQYWKKKEVAAAEQLKQNGASME